MKEKLEVAQFKYRVHSRGGGERVMIAISKALGARVLTLIKEVEGKDFREIGTETDKRIAGMITKV